MQVWILSEPWLIIITGILAFIVQMVYFLKDDRFVNDGSYKDLELKSIWHKSGGFLHIWGAYLVGRSYGFDLSVLFLALLWILFDGSINKYVLNRSFFYVGTTAGIDKFQHKIAGFINQSPETVSKLLKALTIAGGVAILILF